MKFPGTCIVCNEKIQANEVGLWAKGMGVKHEGCADNADELRCAVCGGPAGCPQCELQDSCDIANVSELCVCRGCSEKGGAFASYQMSVGKKFAVLGSGE